MTASASHPDGIPPRIARARSSMAKGPESSETLFGACGGRPPGSKGVGAKLARARSFSALRAVGPGAGPGAPRILPGLLGDLVTAEREAPRLRCRACGSLTPDACRRLGVSQGP